jgi:hypothetical protein
MTFNKAINKIIFIIQRGCDIPKETIDELLAKEVRRD